MQILANHIDESLFWKKKEIISYLLSILIFMIHISSFAQYSNNNSLISVVNARTAFFFKESITRFAVPMFFILSGIVLFRNYDKNKFIKKLKTIFHSLLIPYLLWNTLWMLFEIACSYSFVSSFYVGREPFSFTFINILKGIFFYSCNRPFWFIFNLLIFTLVSPLINLLIRNKYVGIGIVFSLSILLIFDIGLPTSIFYSSDSIVFFLIGAIIGKHYYSCIVRKANRNTQLFSVLFLIIFVVLRNTLSFDAYSLKPFVYIVIFTLCAFSLWNTFDIFVEKTKERPVYARSFAVYALHVNVSAIITKLIYFIFPKHEWFAIPNFIITTILTLIVINVFCVVSERFFPSVYSVLMGHRLGNRN